MSTPSDPQTTPATNASDPRTATPGSVKLGADLGAGEAKAPAAAPKLAYELTDVAVHYGSVKAVQDVTFNLAEREITAFIGPSGCG